MKPLELMAYIKLIERSLVIQAKLTFLLMKVSDVKGTLADTRFLYEIIGYQPDTNIELEGEKFVEW